MLPRGLALYGAGVTVATTDFGARAIPCAGRDF
jgi:hypothetical protein